MTQIQLTAQSIASVLDDAGYVLTTITAYEGFAAAHPTTAFYLGLAAAAAFTLANRLNPTPPQ